MIFGNGGSAADAQHMAAEFVNRFLINRPPLPAIALSTDSSVLTSIGNDFSFDEGLPREIELVDGLNQTTRIEFTEIDVDPDLDAGRFDFVPPRGVSVIGGEQSP